MSLRGHFERSGEWLFRRRSYLPLALFVFPLGAIATEPDAARRVLSPGWTATTLLVSTAGLAVRAWTVGTAPAGTSGRNTHGQVADVLNTTGPYALVRHPLYLGNYLMWLGPALLPGSWQVAVIVSLLFWLYYERIMAAEEAFLGQRFGAEFERWAAETPAFWPCLGRGRPQWRPPALPFSPRTVLRREYTGLFAMLASFALLDAAAVTRVTGRLGLSRGWPAALTAGLVAYVALRWLKRRSRLLSVDGR